MTNRTERLLAEFVDRTNELETFCRMLDASGRPILVFWGGGGLGKSSLLTRLQEECKRQSVLTVHIDDYAHQNYLSVLRSIRDQVGPEGFNAFNDLVNFYTVRNYELKINVSHEGNIEVLRDAVITESTIEVTPIVVNIQDLALLEPRNDMDVPEKERIARLTTRFLRDLASVTRDRRVVLFFDATEKMPLGTRHWLWDRFLDPFADGALPNVRIVYAGRERPELSIQMRRIATEAQLVPLAQEHVVDYLGRRGVDAEHRAELATMLMGIAEGTPMSIALYTDLYLEKKRSQRA